jgi:hypothetical protein
MTSATNRSAGASQTEREGARRCNACGAPLQRELIDLGAMPVSNSLVRPEDMGAGETFYPLRVMVCDACTLAQLVDCPPAGTHFHADYVYFSSTSASWLEHAKTYADAMISRFGLQPGQQVLEVASNDGYLLQFFKQRGFAVQGIEPSGSVAEAAVAKGIPTVQRFFSKATARELAVQGARPRLVVANNVFAHVPDLNDFTAGFTELLEGDAVLTAEVHYFRDLYEKCQFDAIYHEHYSYYTIAAADALFRRNGLALFDAERLPTHGGSIRLYARRATAKRPPAERLARLLEEERAFFASLPADLRGFADRVEEVADQLRAFLVDARRRGKRVAGYGAPAKSAILLNVAGIRTHLMPYTVDNNPQKQGRFLPGVHIPISAPRRILSERPDYVVILPWNLKAEIMAQMAQVKSWDGAFVIPGSKLEVV